MAKYCGICGAELDEFSGLCPNCDDDEGLSPRGRSRQTRGRKTSGRKSGAGVVVLLIVALVVLLVLGLGVMIALEATDTVDIPVMEDMADSVIGIFHKKHTWEKATCTDPKTCEICGKTKGDPLGHDWRDADCVSAGYCAECGAKGDSALGHQWLEATWEAPKTCRVCGATEGDKLPVTEVYINTLDYYEKSGKLWTSGEEAPDCPTHPNADDLSVWEQEDIRGHTLGPVYDNMGNRYKYALHLDGSTTREYYISYELGGRYTKFTGWCGFPDKPLNSNAINSKKYIEIYADGVLVYITGEMTAKKSPEYIEIDVTGVEILEIRYPATKNNNEAATLFDGLLS